MSCLMWTECKSYMPTLFFGLMVRKHSYDLRCVTVAFKQKDRVTGGDCCCNERQQSCCLQKYKQPTVKVVTKKQSNFASGLVSAYKRIHTASTS